MLGEPWWQPGASLQHQAIASGLADPTDEDSKYMLGSERVRSRSKTQEAHPLQAPRSSKEEVVTCPRTHNDPEHTSQGSKMSVLNPLLDFFFFPSLGNQDLERQRVTLNETSHQ